jgi:hypothetical protein
MPGEPRFTAHGTQIDVHRFHTFLGDRRGGHHTDPAVFRKRSRFGLPLSVSFVLDLSVSMEGPRASLGGASPIENALRFVAGIVPRLESAGVPTGIFGVRDFGRRAVDFYDIKGFGASFDPEALRRLHAMQLGGFRFGAILRHLSARLQRERMGTRNVVVLLTDTGSHYLAFGIERVDSMFRKRCLGCQQRCWVEAQEPSVTAFKSPDIRMFYPPSYELADYQAAAAQAANVDPLLVLLDEGYADELLNRYATRWCRYLGAGWEGVVSRNLQQALRGAGKGPGRERLVALASPARGRARAARSEVFSSP